MYHKYEQQLHHAGPGVLGKALAASSWLIRWVWHRVSWRMMRVEVSRESSFCLCRSILGTGF
jgi:hypothetical protein